MANNLHEEKLTEQQIQYLREALAEGEASGIAVEFDPDKFLAQMKAERNARIKSDENRQQHSTSSR
jgi:Arc/MetJ-type ribon-helix-helix transcriptional regulator